MSQSEIQFYCIDRIEEEYAIIEKPDGKMINIKTENLPKEIKEGDCLKKINNIWIIDEYNLIFHTIFKYISNI